MSVSVLPRLANATCGAAHSRFKVTSAYLYVIPPIRDSRIMHSIQTVIHIIRRDPLSSVLPSLCSYACHLVWSSEVDLQPLVVLIMAGRPRTDVPSTLHSVQAGAEWRMEFVPLRWRCHCCILYFSILNSHCSIVESLWKTRMDKWVNRLRVHLVTRKAR